MIGSAAAFDIGSEINNFSNGLGNAFHNALTWDLLKIFVVLVAGLILSGVIYAIGKVAGNVWVAFALGFLISIVWVATKL